MSLHKRSFDSSLFHQETPTSSNERKGRGGAKTQRFFGLYRGEGAAPTGGCKLLTTPPCRSPLPRAIKIIK
jgi:hypothetical protein